MAVVGVEYPNKRGPTRLFEIKVCQPGEPIELRPEPKNPADPHAIAVYSARGVQLGYLTAERAPWIGAQLRAGREVVAVFQAPASFGAWIRIAFDGESPALPPAQEARREPKIGADPDGNFYPDEVWPE